MTSWSPATPGRARFLAGDQGALGPKGRHRGCIHPIANFGCRAGRVATGSLTDPAQAIRQTAIVASTADFQRAYFASRVPVSMSGSKRRSKARPAANVAASG